MASFDENCSRSDERGGGPANGTITINPYTNVPYDGLPHTATGTARGANGEDLDSLLDLSGTTHTNAGVYANDTWTFAGNANYNAAAGTITDSIIKGDLTVGPPGGGPVNGTITITPYTNVPYDGLPHTATGTARGFNGENLDSLLDLSGTTHTNAGVYNGDVWTFAGNANYNSATGTITDSIIKGDLTVGPPGGGPANGTITITPYDVVYNGAPRTATGTARGFNGEDLSSLLDLSGTTHTNAGTYAGDVWTFAGNANYNSASGTITDRIAKVSPAVSVTVSGGTTVGQPISAAANLTLGVNATGTITFNVFTNSSCGGTSVFTSTVAVNGNGSYDSGSFTPDAEGTYYFVAVYNGDNNNNTATSTCDSAGSSQQVGPSPPAELLNISTRLRVELGDKVLIAGFIITGNDPKKVLIRGMGPSLTQSGLTDVLADPVLTLHGPDGSVILSNNNWKDTQQTEIQATTIPPQNDLESAIVATLQPGHYTTVIRGNNGGTGIGIVEVYDLDQTVNSELANLSTRGFVQPNDSRMIGGFILGGPNPGDANILVRAIGPSLTQSGVPEAMIDPTLELRDGQGTLIATNDNWVDDPAQAAAIQATGIAPQNPLESAILATLPPGNYTGLVADKLSRNGNALVEVYNLH